MDSYVVRIYRRSAADPEQAAGEVEIVDTRERRAFTDFKELQRILSLQSEATQQEGRSA